jgi:hypothetical protein
MHPTHARLSFFVLAIACLLLLPGAALAQSTDLPAVPNPSECQAEPRSAESLQSITGSPEPSLTAETEADLPQGEPADTDTVAAIVAAERHLIACTNAGDFSRLLALLTDRAILSITSGTPTQEMIDILLSQATPEASDNQTSLVQVRDVRILGPDRVGAIAEWGIAADPAVVTEINFHVFVRDGDRWLLDDEVSGLPVPSASASPAA